MPARAIILTALVASCASSVLTFLVGFAVAAVVIHAPSAAAQGVATPTPVSTSAVPAPVLRTERLELVDSEGRIRVRLGIEADRSVGLGVLDQAGNARLVAGVTTDERPVVGFVDHTGQQRSSWALTPDGAPSIVFHNPQHGTVVIGAFGDGPIGLGVLDVSRQPRVRLVMNPDGGEGLMLYDATGQPRLLFGLQSDGTPNVGQVP